MGVKCRKNLNPKTQTRNPKPKPPKDKLIGKRCMKAHWELGFGNLLLKSHSSLFGAFRIELLLDFHRLSV